jgi:type II protein arginine methyltransferase
MFSWYCIFFPIKDPIECKKNDKIELEFWRKCGPDKVWYEWKVVSPEESIVHNKDGVFQPIFL